MKEKYKNWKLYDEEVLNKTLKLFPLKLPVWYKSQKIGTINVNFDLPGDISTRKKPRLKNIITQFLCQFMQDFFIFLGKKEYELDLILNQDEKIWETLFSKTSSSELLDWLLKVEIVPPLPPLNQYLYQNEEAIFELLKSEGPYLLSNTGVLLKIEEWTRENKTANLNKVFKALKKCKNPKSLPEKVGRPSISIDKNKAYKIYKYILLRMRWMKIAKDWRKIDKAEKFYLRFMKKKNAFSKELINKWLSKEYYNLKLIHCIDSDEKLRNEFYEYQWVPHKMAKKITTRLLEIGEETLIDILWRKRKNKKK